MKILFLCTLNAVRSPIAAAFARHYHPEHTFASAGIISGPVDYFAVEVMEEVGHSIEGHEPKSFDNLKNKSYDLVICLANEATPEMKKMLAKHNLKYEFWTDIPSPADMGGSRLMRLFSYREIRDKIKSRVKNWDIPK